MPDREKVEQSGVLLAVRTGGEVGMTVERMIELLEIEKECVLRNASGECNRYCAGCDLLQDDTELHEMYTEAIALLKAQEPRLLTADDFVNNPDVDHDGFLPAWIEYRRDGDWDEYWEGQPDEWGVCRADRLVYETMRYWTSRPTKEQMEATPWN